MEWRLILDPPCPAPYNMAKDEVCLRRVARGGAGVVRLYSWDRFVLSVGRTQKVDRQIDLDGCRAAGIPLMRRATGGRAVLHGSDLTYSVTAPTGGEGFAPGIMAIYREISLILQIFFRELGFEPEVKTYSGRERGEMASAVCFSTPSAFEIVIGGKKIVGSAQRLLPSAFLQHGSLPLAPQEKLLAKIFRGVTEEEIRGQMTDLATLGLDHGQLERGQLTQKLVQAFENHLGTPLLPLNWGEEDEALVAALEAEYPLFLDEEPPGRFSARKNPDSEN